MGRRKTTVGRIKDCLSALSYWDKNKGTKGEVEARALFGGAIKAHLVYADEKGEVVPDDIRIKAEGVVI